VNKLNHTAESNWWTLHEIYQISVSSSRPHICTSCRIRELVFILQKQLHTQLHQQSASQKGAFISLKWSVDDMFYFSGVLVFFSFRFNNHLSPQYCSHRKLQQDENSKLAY